MNSFTEITMTLEGTTVHARPTFRALMTIEQRSGKGMMELASSLTEGTLSLEHMALILSTCLQAAGHKEWDMASVGEAMVREGVSTYIPTVRDLLMQVLQGVSDDAESTLDV